jgi:hypothetical protein
MQLLNLNAGPHVLFLDVEAGESVPARIAITAGRTGSGCDSPAAGGNAVRYDVDFSSAFQSEAGPSCGLTMDSLPSAIGERLTGSLSGTIPSANAGDPATREIKITFDVPRLK